MKSDEAIVVFDAHSPNAIIGNGGSQAWIVSPERASKCEWLVVTQNQNSHPEVSGATEPHGSAFLVARVSGVSPVPQRNSKTRWKIEFDEYARIEKDNVWDGSQNPVRYTSLAAIGIDTRNLQFRKLGAQSS